MTLIGWLDRKLSTQTNKQILYSRISMARTSLGPWKFIRNMGSLSHWGLIMAPVQEANSDNLGKSFRFSTQWLCVHIIHGKRAISVRAIEVILNIVINLVFVASSPSISYFFNLYLWHDILIYLYGFLSWTVISVYTCYRNTWPPTWNNVHYDKAKTRISLRNHSILQYSLRTIAPTERPAMILSRLQHHLHVVISKSR